MKVNKMEKQIIGNMHFGPFIDITDPCYDRNVWCRMNNVQIIEGEYTCVIWLCKESYVFNSKEHTYTSVGRIGIYLDGTIPDQNDMEEIGEIGVDAGLAGFFMDKPDYTDDEWSDFCDSIETGNAWIKPEGFFSNSGGGDGCYPVVVARDNKGDINAVEIIFYEE